MKNYFGKNILRKNIEGAPFRIFDHVTIGWTDDFDLDEKYTGRQGKIVYYEYECGCGQTYPDDPMIGVLFFDDNSTVEFWKDELMLVEKDGAPRNTLDIRP